MDRFGLKNSYPHLSNIYTAEAQTRDCGGVERDISQTAELVKKSFKDRDVSNDVEYIERIVQKCSVNIAKFGWGQGIFDYWKNTGYEAELDRAKEQIEHYSNYRDVSPELERFKKFSLKLKTPQNEISKYYSQYVSKGKKSEAIEGKNCQPTVDLRNDTLGEVRDQDSIGWCYAFASADLLTYRLGKKVSAVDFAMAYHDGIINNFLKKMGSGVQDFQGDYRDGLKVGIGKLKSKGGICLEENLRSEDNGYTNLMSNLVSIDNLKKKVAGTAFTNNCSTTVQKIFPTLPADEISKIAENSTRAEFMNALSDKACKPRIALNGLEADYRSKSLLGDTSEVMAEIDRQLSKKNPLTVAYDANFLYNRNHKGKFGGHTSAIFGRRFNPKNGECEYLIRNSWGRGCSSYDPYYTCEAGNIWLPKSVLSKGVVNVGFIK